MPAKKKPERISPKIAETIEGTNYSDLNDGDCFIWEGELWIKSDWNDQEAINLATGEVADCMCGNIVIPVDVQITWTKK